jgi:hypothetical protein
MNTYAWLAANMQVRLVREYFGFRSSDCRIYDNIYMVHLLRQICHTGCVHYADLSKSFAVSFILVVAGFHKKGTFEGKRFVNFFETAGLCCVS